jgi:HPt (histidine-containing phosphotransfer) domain-containing protein
VIHVGRGTVLDQATLDNLKRLGGDDFLHELFDLFLEHSPVLAENINHGRTTADWDLVARAAHSLKSSAGNIGAFGLLSLASDLEQAANISDVPAITLLVDQIGTSFDTVVEELKKLRK